MRRNTKAFPRLPLTPLARVRQQLSTDHIADIRGRIRLKLLIFLFATPSEQTSPVGSAINTNGWLVRI